MRKKAFFLIMMLAGALIGPGYWFYDKLYSGEVAMTLDLVPTGDGGYATAPFHLDAAMQPAGLIFRSQGSFVPRQDEDKPPIDGYTATLYRDGVASKSLPFPLAARSVSNTNPAFNERLLWLDKLQSGEYRFEIKPLQAPVITLEHPRLEVRSGVQEPNNTVATTGFLMLVFGILGLFLG